MTIDAGLSALAAVVADRLILTEYISSSTALHVDDADAVAPSGDEIEYLTWAALTRGETRVVRTILGRPAPRYVVEHRASLQLAWAGPDQIAGKARHALALSAIAGLSVDLPTLGGAVERFFIEAGDEEPLPPNGWGATVVLAFRIRSGDPLGLTP